MDTWTELIDGPIGWELLQSEMLFQKMIDFIPLITLFAVIMFFGLVGIFAVLDRMLLKDKDIPQVCKTFKKREQNPDTSGCQCSKPATRFLLNDTNAAA